MQSRGQPFPTHSDSLSTAYSDDVDSAGTTLQGTPRSTSGDWNEGSTRSKLHNFRGIEKKASDGTPTGDHDGFSEGDDDDFRDSEDRGVARLLRSNTAEATGLDGDTAPSFEPTEQTRPVSWAQLPRKGQLAIIVLARFSEPLTQTSLQAYMFYQLKSFTLPSGDAPSDSTVARQAGLLLAAFNGAQFCSAIFWGRMADSERMGRKRVLLVGLAGMACMSLGFGLSQSFAVAMFWRCIGGLLNGNIGVMKTLVSEIVREKRYQSRAFLLLPMGFNIGAIIGPLLGGILADPVHTYPDIFGPDGSLGGSSKWMAKFPYALPNVVNAVFLTFSALAVTFGLEETLDGLKHKSDYGIKFRNWIWRIFTRSRFDRRYVPVSGQEEWSHSEDIELRAGKGNKSNSTAKPRRKLPFRRIWTRNVLFMLLSHALMAGHVAAFNSLWFVFLSTPRYDPKYVPSTQESNTAASNSTHKLPLQNLPPDYKPLPPLIFTGGLALSPRGIGSALALLGTIGIMLQLLLYPRVSFRLGPLRSLRYALCFFPVAYALAPFLALLPSSTPPPAAASGAFIWLGIAAMLCILVIGRTFAFPSSTILVNNSSPHPSVLGTVHGIAQSVGSGAKTAGPALGGWIYSLGLNAGVVGLAWWCIAGVAILGAAAAQLVWEGDGHEIWLEGEKEELEVERRRAEGSMPGGRFVD